jgi:hypothetical protein
VNHRTQPRFSDGSLPVVEDRPRWKTNDTFMFRKGNTNIPRLHARSWGTAVNQSTLATHKASNIATIMRPTPLARSISCTAAQTTTEEQADFQTDRTLIARKPRETRIHSFASVNENSDDAGRDRSEISVKATINHVPVKLRKSLGIAPMPTLLFPATVVRIWRIDK